MSSTYNPGDVYFCTFPKFVQRPDTNDFNIDSMKTNPSPRPIAVLHEIDSNRIIAVPISADDIKNNRKFDTFVPLKASNYPAFLKKDSYVKTNQLQVLDTKWLYRADASSPVPTLVGSLNPTDLDRVQYITLYATQTERSYAKWISEIVSKNVKQINRGDLEDKLISELGFSPRTERKIQIKYDREDIVKCHFQPMIHDQSPERVSGSHLAVMLTDDKYGHMPGGQRIVVPLVENTAENMRYASALDVGITVGDKVLRACVSQIQPMNRDWIEGSAGRVDKPQMLDLDRSVIGVLGMKQQVIEKSRSVIKEVSQARSKAR